VAVAAGCHRFAFAVRDMFKFPGFHFSNVDMHVSFPGGVRVDVNHSEHMIRTDQPRSSGGKGEYPAPMSLFLASIAACTGLYVLRFCQERGVGTDGLKLDLSSHFNRDEGVVDEVEISITLPVGFPDKYRKAIVLAAKQCTVKKTIQYRPKFTVQAK